MNVSKSWTIARKDFSVFRQKKTVLYTLIAFPLAVSIGLPTVLALVVHRGQATYSQLASLTDAFGFFFMITAVTVSTGLAAYSIVGEKVDRSLEPLLATPTEDSEILLGKILASFLPSIASTALGTSVFMVYVDILSRPQLGYYLYPNWTMGVVLLIAAPLACLFSVEANVLVSTRVSDIRTAQQFGGLLVLPFAALYVMGEIRVLTLDEPTLLLISGALAVVDLVLFPLTRAAFRREDILTRWK